MTSWRPVRLALIGGLAIAVASLLEAHTLHESRLSHRAVDPTTPYRCPPQHGDLDLAGTDTLPAGATQARLCVRANHSPWYPPHDVLRTHLVELVALVNAQQVHDPSSDDACAGVGAPAFAMIFSYRAGTRTITGDTGGCWDLHVGNTQRSGSKDVYDGYLSDLARQRTHGSPTARHDPSPSCPSGPIEPFAPIAAPARVVGAVLCTHPGVVPGRTHPGVPLSPDQLAVLRRDLATAAVRTVESPDPRCRQALLRQSFSLSAMDAWGDRFIVQAWCGMYRVLMSARPYRELVRLQPATTRLLERLTSLQP